MSADWMALPGWYDGIESLQLLRLAEELIAVLIVWRT